MFGLTPLGIAHTIISLMAIIAGFYLLYSSGRITPLSNLGKFYIGATLFSALSALSIYRHGGFGPGHALAVLTLVALAVGYLATYSQLFGRFSMLIQTLSISATLLFHAIPGVTEALTRLPLGNDGVPIFDSALAPNLQKIHLFLLALFIVGVILQIRAIKSRT